MIKACIFDLDGVIVDTAKYHYTAWKKLANSLGFDFTEKDNEKLKGVSRVESLELILKWGNQSFSQEKKAALAEQKNAWYQDYINEMGADEILEGIPAFFEELKAKKIKIALGSASKNAGKILDKIGLTDSFEAIIDGNVTIKGKPDPEVFLRGAEALGVAPSECIVFEDAAKGVEAALNGGFYAVGIGEEESLSAAHLVLPNLVGMHFDTLVDQLT